MVEHTPLTQNPTNKQDDFEQNIKGIGEVSAQALYEIGIYRYKDLATLTPQKLVELIGSRVKSISVKRIERDDWLGQAEALASTKDENNRVKRNSNKTERPISAKHDEIKHKNHAEYNGVGWQEIADFFVSFGHALGPDGEMGLFTRVHHSQADNPEQWEGIAKQELIDWMLEQAKLSSLDEDQFPEDPQVELVEQNKNEQEEEVQIDIADLWVEQVERPALIDRVPTPGTIRIESRVNISGSDALSLTHECLPYNVQAYLVNEDTHQSECVSVYNSRLSPKELSYEIRQDFPTPKQGSYRISLIGQLSMPGTNGTLCTVFRSMQGPILRVEP